MRIIAGVHYQRADGVIVGPAVRASIKPSSYLWRVGTRVYTEDGTLASSGGVQPTERAFNLVRAVTFIRTPDAHESEAPTEAHTTQRVSLTAEQQREFDAQYRGAWRAEPQKPMTATKRRPFKSADEFAPHRERWARNKTGMVARIIGYDDDRIVFASTVSVTWHYMFENYVFDDDGTLFGVDA